MKKQFTLFLGVLSVVSLLSSCQANSKNTSVTSKEVPVSIVAANIESNDKTKSYSLREALNITNYSEAVAYGNNFYVIKANNFIKIFFTQTGKLVTVPESSLISGTLSSLIKKTSYLSYEILSIEIINRVYHYDIFGNLIYDHFISETYSISENIIYDENDSGKVTNIEYSFKETSTNNVKSFKYVNDFSQITSASATVTTSNIANEIEGIKLDKYGLKGYYVVLNNGSYMVFKDQKYVGAFAISSGKQFIAKGCFYFQESILLPEDAKDYTYSNGTNKYLLKTYKIDIKSAKKTEIDVPYVFVSGESIKDEKGNYSLQLANVKLIDNKVLMSENKEYIIGENGALIYSCENSPLGSIKKLGTNYINTNSGLVYNAKLNPIKIVNNYNVSVVDETHVIFSNSSSSSYGVADQNLDVLIPASYNRVYYAGEDTFLCMKDNNFEYKKITNGSSSTIKEVNSYNYSFTYLGYGIVSMYDGSSNSTRIYDSKGEVKTLNDVSYLNRDTPVIVSSTFNDEKEIYVVTKDTSSTNNKLLILTSK